MKNKFESAPFLQLMICFLSEEVPEAFCWVSLLKKFECLSKNLLGVFILESLKLCRHELGLLVKKFWQRHPTILAVCNNQPRRRKVIGFRFPQNAFFCLPMNCIMKENIFLLIKIITEFTKFFVALKDQCLGQDSRVQQPAF